jgi:hypothetical protein
MSEKIEIEVERIVIDVDHSSDKGIKELILWLMSRNDVEWSLEDYHFFDLKRIRGEQ